MKNYNLCQKYSKISEFILKTVFFSYTAMLIVIVLPSIIQFFTAGKVTPPMRVYFPGLRGESIIGIAILIIFNYIVSILALYVASCFDILVYLIFANMPMVSLVITRQLKDLEVHLLDDKRNTLRNTKYRLRDIVLMILKYNQ